MLSTASVAKSSRIPKISPTAFKQFVRVVSDPSVIEQCFAAEPLIHAVLVKTEFQPLNLSSRLQKSKLKVRVRDRATSSDQLPATVTGSAFPSSDDLLRTSLDTFVSQDLGRKLTAQIPGGQGWVFVASDAGWTSTWHLDQTGSSPLMYLEEGSKTWYLAPYSAENADAYGRDQFDRLLDTVAIHQAAGDLLVLRPGMLHYVDTTSFSYGFGGTFLHAALFKEHIATALLQWSGLRYPLSDYYAVLDWNSINTSAKKEKFKKAAKKEDDDDDEEDADDDVTAPANKRKKYLPEHKQFEDLVDPRYLDAILSFAFEKIEPWIGRLADVEKSIEEMVTDDSFLQEKENLVKLTKASASSVALVTLPPSFSEGSLVLQALSLLHWIASKSWVVAGEQTRQHLVVDQNGATQLIQLPVGLTRRSFYACLLVLRKLYGAAAVSELKANYHFSEVYLWSLVGLVMTGGKTKPQLALPHKLPYIITAGSCIHTTDEQKTDGKCAHMVSKKLDGIPVNVTKCTSPKCRIFHIL